MDVREKATNDKRLNSCEDTKKACVAHVVDWLQQPTKED